MMTRNVGTAYLGLLVLASGCDGWRTPSGPPASIDAELRQSLGGWGVVPIGPTPAQAPALVDLGQALMFDKVLSGNRDIACATCHNPVTHAADGLALSVGTGGTGLGPSRTLGPGRQFVPRNAPTLLNAGLGSFYLFLDGRVSGFRSGPFQTPAGVALPSGLPTLLAAQAMFPVMNREEMRGAAGDRDRFGNPNELAEFGDSDFVSVWPMACCRHAFWSATSWASLPPGFVATQSPTMHGAAPRQNSHRHDRDQQVSHARDYCIAPATGGPGQAAVPQVP